MRPGFTIRSRFAATLALLALLAGCFALRAPAAAPQLARPFVPAGDATELHSISVTWIGHATALIRIEDRWFLTDPVLGDRIGGIYPRRVAAGIERSAIPPLDAVLISHAHFDHLDVPTLRGLDRIPVVLVPRGAATFLPDDLATDEVAALDTWGQWSRGGVTITAVPSSHGDGRYLVDRWNRDSHTSWIIEYRGLTVYFAGDTGYVPAQAAAIAAGFQIDVALLPVGPAGRWSWVERWRRDVHATPDDAMTLFEACGAQWMIPIHFGTFFESPARELPYIQRAIARHPLARRVRMLTIGETTELLY